jgi:S-(hydroxymethyl)glutathione dehydrogenase/alcohol dehydrogenase
MKAAVLFETGKPLRLIDGIELPALLPGQVEVEIAYSGVCHSQLMEVRGKRGEDKYLPHLLGHEATGVVRAAGEGVCKIAVGDKVILGWIRGEGMEASGALYSWRDQVINSGGITTFNERAIVAENRLVPLPAGLPMDLGVLFGCAIPTGAGLALNEINITPDDMVVVIGIGGIGAVSLMYAHCCNPKKLIAIDVNEEKLEAALKLGASHALNGGDADILEQVVALTDGMGADYALDAAGHTATIELAFNAVRRNGGRCVFASHPAAGQKISIDPFELVNGKHIHGSWGGGTRPDQDLPRFYQMAVDQNLPLKNMITKRYSLDNVNAALDDLEAGRVMRPLLEINPSLGE